jgi:hypothetical protein
MTDNNDIEYILGIQIQRDPSSKTLILSQAKYIETILTKFNMASCKPIATPLEAGIRYSKTQANDLSPDDEQYMTTVPYSQILGCLQYLVTCTRSDLAYLVNHLAQFMSSPAPVHWLALKRLLRYLRKTSHSSLLYSGSSSSSSLTYKLEGWCDAEWAGDIDTRRSTTGYLFKLNGNLLSWHSKKQQVVALSSTEAEYVAAATATKELVWLQTLLSEIGYSIQMPCTIFSDNQSSIALSKNPRFHERSKHIEIKYHFLREKVETNVLQLEYTPTGIMWADILTKSLPKSKHDTCAAANGLTGFTTNLDT